MVILPNLKEMIKLNTRLSLENTENNMKVLYEKNKLTCMEYKSGNVFLSAGNVIYKYERNLCIEYKMKNIVESIRVSSDGNMLACGFDCGMILIFSIKNREMKFLKKIMLSNKTKNFDFSPDCKKFAFLYYDTLKLLSTDGFDNVWSNKYISDLSDFIAFSPDSKIIASGTNFNHVKFFSVEDGGLIKSFHVKSITSTSICSENLALVDLFCMFQEEYF